MAKQVATLDLTDKFVKDMSSRILKALDVAARYGSTDGAHHKQWVIDQMVRHLAGHGYEEWFCKQKQWGVGIPP